MPTPNTTTPATLSKGSYITPPVILSYPALFEPKTVLGSAEPVYSCTLVFLPDTPAEIRKELDELIDAAGREKHGANYVALKAAGGMKLPIRMDAVKKGYPPRSYWFNCRSKFRPGIVGPHAGPDGRPTLLTDPDQLYSGCIVRASISFFGFNAAGNVGVGVGLRNLQKLRESTRLDKCQKTEDEFHAVAEAALEDSLFWLEE